MAELTRKEVQEKINDFFKNLDGKSASDIENSLSFGCSEMQHRKGCGFNHISDIKKIKKMAMKFNIRLGDLRKRFCKKCLSPNLKVKGIKKGIKNVECQECRNLMKWKV
jgi:RNase P subunit RPR2